jgi:hypothetical protein
MKGSPEDDIVADFIFVLLMMFFAGFLWWL